MIKFPSSCVYLALWILHRLYCADKFFSFLEQIAKTHMIRNIISEIRRSDQKDSLINEDKKRNEANLFRCTINSHGEKKFLSVPRDID